MSNVKQFTDVISQLKLDKMYEGDFFLTWEKSFDEIKGVFAVADALRHLRENNISAKIFDSGLGISLSGIIPPAPASPSHRPATCWALRCRIWTKGRARLPTAKPCAKPPT